MRNTAPLRPLFIVIALFGLAAAVAKPPPAAGRAIPAVPAARAVAERSAPALHLPLLLRSAPLADLSVGPALLGQLGGPVRSAALDGEQLVLGVGPRLVVVSLAEPDRPRVVGRSLVLPARPTQIVLAGRHAFVALGPPGTAVFDLADPTRPQLVGFLPGKVGGWSLAAHGSTAFVADAADGVWLVEPGPDGRPARSVALRTGGPVEWLSVDGERLYVGLAASGPSRAQLLVYALDLEPQPVLLARGDAPSGGYGMVRSWVVADGVAYLSRGNGGLTMVDLRHDEVPATVTLALTDLPSLTPLAVHGKRLLAGWESAGQVGVVLLDIAEPLAPRLDGVIDGGQPLGARALAGLLGERLAVVVAATGDVALVDLAVPGRPGRTIPELVAWAALVRLGRGSLLAVTYDGARWLHVTDPANPVVEALPDGWPWGAPLAADGPILVARPAQDATDRAVLIDVADPLHPRLLSTVVPVESGIWDAALGTGYLALGTENALELFDVSDPGHPVRRDALSLAPDRDTQAVVLGAGVVYLATDHVIQTLAIESGGRWRELGRLTFDLPVRRLALRGPTLAALTSPGSVEYPANTAEPPDRWSRLQLLDVAEPISPRLLGAIALDAWPRGLALVGTRAYIARVDAPTELLAVDIADRAAPRVLGAGAMMPDDAQLLWTGYGKQSCLYSPPPAVCRRDVRPQPPFEMTPDDDTLWLSSAERGVWAFR
jgi:hypothetical protein